MPDQGKLLIIIPTRSRPEAIAKVVEAWRATGAFEDGAEPLFAIDQDDPRAPEYLQALDDIPAPEFHRLRVNRSPEWQPMVHKLDDVARRHARYSPEFVGIGFAGDDHLPRTPGWARQYLETLKAHEPCIVYCDDGYQHENLPTQWAMSASIVRTLGRMVPAPVDHLYCDNAVKDLGEAVDGLIYLPDVLIEHMHPIAGKAENDEQYTRVNSGAQYVGDRRAYRQWRERDLWQQAEKIKALRVMGEGR